MSNIEKRLQATQEAIADGEARLQRAWSNLARSARPDVQVERQVALQVRDRPHMWWLGAFAAGVALGCLHGSQRRLSF